ncbi:MAG: GNAT family N-acetyltransferase [Candidatus Eremiobacteraeota bacterium]|nr:GNAT family N-acetyltransferase [Candidatus Eremiobacteraeota bacterium]
MSFEIREITTEDRKKVLEIIEVEWGIPIIVKDRTLNPENLPGFIVYDGENIAGLVTYNLENNECEIVTMNSFRRNMGIGTALIKKVKNTAKAEGCIRLWLITTNDNVDAIRFYQTRKFRMTAIHRDAIDKSRKIKPRIPDTGCYGIPLHDEVEMEILL